MFWKSTCDAHVKLLTMNVVNNGQLKILYPNLSVKFEDGNIVPGFRLQEAGVS